VDHVWKLVTNLPRLKVTFKTQPSHY